MSGVLESWLLTMVLALSRIGACFLLLPGLGTARVPVQMRLFIALALSMALVPLLEQEITTRLVGIAPARLLELIAGESAIGLLFGTMIRAFFVALGFAAVFLTNLIGMANQTPSGLEDGGELASPLSDLIILTAVLAFFLLNLHIEVLGAIVESYSRFPLGGGIGSELALAQIARTLQEAFLIALGFSGPLLVYAVVVNVLLGIANRLIPQISVQFISAPLVLNGGLIVLYLAAAAMFPGFFSLFESWLQRV